MKSLRVLLLGLLFFVTGCQAAFEVRLAPEAKTVGSLAFDIAEKATPNARPRYNTVRLIEADSKDLVWHLRAAPFSTDASQARLSFPQTPEGFEAVVKDPQLLPGHTYVLVISGKAHGQLRFEVGERGEITPL